MPSFEPNAFQLFWAIVGVAFTIAAYTVMIIKTLAGKARPHPLGWLGFGGLTAVGFFVQWQKGAGAGSWVMGFTFIACFVVAGVSQRKGRWHLADFDAWDWFALVLGLGCGVLYASSRNLSFGPLASTIWATLGDLILYIPIVRNAKMRPDDEIATGYFLNSVKFWPTFYAMSVLRLETYLYPAVIAIVNMGVVIYLNWRRCQLGLQPRLISFRLRS